MSSSSIILASKSPRRKNILKQIGIDFEIIPVFSLSFFVLISIILKFPVKANNIWLLSIRVYLGGIASTISISNISCEFGGIVSATPFSP